MVKTLVQFTPYNTIAYFRTSSLRTVVKLIIMHADLQPSRGNKCSLETSSWQNKAFRFPVDNSSAGPKARAQRQISLAWRDVSAVCALRAQSGSPSFLRAFYSLPNLFSFFFFFCDMSPVTVFCLTTQARTCRRQARLATLSAQCASHYKAVLSKCGDRAGSPGPARAEWGARGGL